MVIECLQCWWEGVSAVPVFFDAADLYRHERASHSPTMYAVQEMLAAPWIAVGFAYQAAFTETGELVLAHPWSPEDHEAPPTSDPALRAMARPSAAAQPTLW